MCLGFASKLDFHETIKTVSFYFYKNLFVFTKT